MGTNAEVLSTPGIAGPETQGQLLQPVATTREAGVWNPEEFAREQIRNLVRRVFFATGSSPVRQVVFTATGRNTDTAALCDQVGEALAMETRADIAVVSSERLEAEIGDTCRQFAGSTVKSRSTQTAANLWRVPGFGPRECEENFGTGQYWISCLTKLRNEFEYAVIQGPAANVSSEFVLLGQLTDGIILVIEAHGTRKAIARKIKETLTTTQSRILGTVLSGRRFPVPYEIYRRL